MYSNYDYKFSLSPNNVYNLPSIATKVVHYQNSTSFDTNLHFMYNPDFLIDIDSKWKIEEGKDHTNYTGTVYLTSPFNGMKNGVLISKIYRTDRKYIKGIAKLYLEHKICTVSMEGRFRKIMNSMLVVNVTTPEESYQSRFIISEENRHFVALVTYPTGSLGTEVLFKIHSLTNFDTIFTIATPIEFLQKFIIVGKLKEGEADFRLGWNFLLVGFSGVWHYANVTDFEYSYKIYTPIEGCEENGVVGKLIFKEGLDFEVSINLSNYKLGVKLLGQPKTEPLKELGIKTQDIYRKRLSRNSDENEEDDPISWEGLIELNVIIYPTMTGYLEIDQKGLAYILQGKFSLPNGNATLFDEFEYIDLFSINNKLEMETPFPMYKTIMSNFNLKIQPGSVYFINANLDYQNQTRLIKTGVFAQYLSEIKPYDERIYNATLKINTPFEALPKLDAIVEYEMEENFYRTRVDVRTLNHTVALDLTAETEDEVTEAVANILVKTPSINIPSCHLTLRKEFTDTSNDIEINIRISEIFRRDIHGKLSWLIKSIKEFRVTSQLQTPYLGMENSVAGIDVHISDAKSNIWTELQLHPVQIEINSSIDNTKLQMTSNLNVNGQRIPLIVDCKILKISEGGRKLNGTLVLKEKKFVIGGNAVIKSNIPVRVKIGLTPVDGTDALKFEYQLESKRDGYELVGSIRRSDKLTEFNVYASGNDTFNWEFKLQVEPPSKIKYFANAKATSSAERKNIVIDLTTPFPKLEEPKFGASLITHGSEKSISGYFQFTEASGNLNVNLIWKFLEDMLIKANTKFQSKVFNTTSHIEAFYKNPKKIFQFLQLGGDINIKNLWEAGSNITVLHPVEKVLRVETHLKLPDKRKEVHSLIGDLKYANNLKTIEYLTKYRTTFTKRKYGLSGKISMEDDKDMKGNIELEWDGMCFNNFANLKRPKDVIELIYKLKTPKFSDRQLFVALVNLKTLVDHYNLTCEAFYPEKRSVAFATVNYKELGNMNGMFNVTVPYKNLNFTGAIFNTLTSDKAYNRYVKVFWSNDTAILDGKCNIIQGVGLNERHTKGKLIIELPLTTRHIADIDFKYDKSAKLSNGNAVVNYNGDKVLVAKYNCLSEMRTGFNKDTIHVELQNEMLPIGANYVHGQENVTLAEDPRSNAPTVVDEKYLHLYNLKNQSKFNVTGKLNVRTRQNGQDYMLTAIHLNRTVRLWLDYDVLDREYKQHSRLELSPTTWIEYDLDLLNNTVDETFSAQQIQINVSYPSRNFTAQGFYNISDSIVSTDVSLMWDKDNKSVHAGLDWRKVALHRDQIQLSIKHPSFQEFQDVKFLGEYGYGTLSMDASLIVNYSADPDQTFRISGLLSDNSNIQTSNYTYSLEAEHKATSLFLNSSGDIYWNLHGYGTEHLTKYKRSYLPLNTAETFAKVNFNQNVIELKNENNVAGLSYLWGRYGGKFPVYTANISATHGINDTSGEFYLNLRKKLLYLDFNMTEDGSQSLHVNGIIPDARSAQFDIWRDYDDIRESDISYYLRLNHSRLIMSRLLWRKDLISDVQNRIRNGAETFYNDSLKAINETQQYVIAQTMEAINDIWQDAKPIVQQFLNDVRNLTVIEEDFEHFKKFLNESYHANEFYMKDIATRIVTLFDELSVKSHLSSLPKIVQEVWEVMGASGEKIKNGITWVVEKVKTYYKNTAEFVHDLLNGDPIEHLTDYLKHLVEKYDEYIKNLHVAVIQYMEKLWSQTSSYIVDNWHKSLAAIEPTFITIAHYLETIVWNTSKQFLDFMYNRKNEIIGNPYFAKFTNFTQDLDKFYKDITGDNTIASIYKYTKMGWNFLKEKYLNNVPFAKEVQEIINEILSEVAELQNVPSIKQITEKYYESYEYVKYYYEYFIVQNKIHKFLATVYMKITDKALTALEIENNQREAKTKFIFDPNEGIMHLEQKLPMSWHAFNETPAFQEIPEIKTIYDIQEYFTASQNSFWNLYQNYIQYLNYEDILPPFKGQAMLIGSKYYVTFDRKYYNFQGSCMYLLATDFQDRNFTLLVSYDDIENTNEFLVILNKTVVHINVFKDTVKIGNSPLAQLPLEIGETYLYRESDIVTVDSSLGFVLKCNMKFHICMFEMSGYYFGKTAGLWGTLNNEPSDDLLMSNKTKSSLSHITEFADSWLINNKCTSTKRKVVQKAKSSIKSSISSLCKEFFISKLSDLANCFPRVPKEPFISMCLNSTTEQEACMSAISYINLCAYEDTPLRIPDTCVKCELLNGTLVKEGETVRYKESNQEQSADVVFIIEAKKCNKNIRTSRNFDIVIDMLEKELTELNITNNRYAVVVFGGNGVFDEPRSIVLHGNTFADHHNIVNYFSSVPTGNGNTDIFNAITFANGLIFRPGVSRNFVLLPCSKCHENNMMHDYSTVHTKLFDSAISLHILMNDNFHQQKDKDSKLTFGVDLTAAYTKKDTRNLIGDQALRKSINLPKSTLGVCTSLALESNGSVFSSKYLETDKRNAKKFSTVFAKRVAKSATLSTCLDCECTASNSGVSYMECNPCTARINIENYFDEEDAFSFLQQKKSLMDNLML